METVRKKGATMLYAVVSILALLSVISLAIDWGRVQVVKAQLQTSADAAARYAVSGLQNNFGGTSAAADNAAAVVAQNFADAHTINFDKNADVEIGKFNTSSHNFVANNNLNVANAVRVTLRCTAARNSAVPLTFLSIFGKSKQDVTVSSIAMIDYNAATGGAGNGTYEYYIPATSNPWLAGMPNGTIANANNPANNPDYAGSPFSDNGSSKASGVNNGNGGSNSGNGNGSNSSNWSNWGDYSSKKASPITAGGIKITPGSTISFDGVNGGANNFASSTLYDGDGNLDWVINNYGGSENGISDIYSPINAVVAVFLSDSQPNTTTAPPVLDFSTQASRDYLTLSPKLKQTFFVGNGRTSTGEVQKIVVPPGATRMFIGSMDGWEWNNNVGGFNVTAHASGKIYSVNERIAGNSNHDD